jgi:pSer/pThr/pTyr-binding forkhead associated (FHA) protein
MPVADGPEDLEAEANTEVVAQLYLVRGAGPEEIPIAPGVNSIGRMPDNTICIRNDRYISGHHATIEAEVQYFRLIDLGSTNGTFLNGLRLTTNEAIMISEGDEITLGGTVYVFRQSLEAQAEPASETISVEPESALVEEAVEAE